MKREVVLLDLQTQEDFFLPRGAKYTGAAEEVRYHIYRLFDWFRRVRQPVISTLLRCRPSEPGPMGEGKCCLEGTLGEKKLYRTILPSHIDLGMRNITDVPPDLLERYQQIIFELRHPDIFLHARAERLLTELSDVTYVLCGAGLTYGVVQAAVGLRSRGKSVILARDAVLDFGHPDVEMACERMLAKGVQFARTHDVIAPRAARKTVAAFRRSGLAHTDKQAS